MKDFREIIQDMDRYKDFTILDNPVLFKDMFANRNIDVVQLHSIQVDNDRICGFCGSFEWKDNKIIPHDGDSYTADMLVYGYNWWGDATTENNEYVEVLGLDILVLEW